ncbi:spore-associated protein A [Streptomyces sp. NPDC023838]|uniref:spore-associated protein A n=1 Tax=Streptomyces sp. NPDC023838 TaxID=3154325 RepID=UPI00340460DE
MKHGKRYMAVALALPSVAGILAAAPEAAAATPHNSRPAVAAQPAGGEYNGACGSGYEVIDEMRLESGATVYLTYSASGYNCVVTVRQYPGSPAWTTAWLANADDSSSRREDADDYTSYAGPVFVYAKGSCVSWGGRFMYGYTDNTGHCG